MFQPIMHNLEVGTDLYDLKAGKGKLRAKSCSSKSMERRLL